MASVSLYFIRHGIAAERGTYANDAERPLTDEGRKKTRQVAKRLHELGLRFDLLITSPLVRAEQTAAIFQATAHDTAKYYLPVQVSEFLAPDRNFTDWFDQFQQNLKHQSGNLAVGLIGHEPDLSAWAEILVWGEVRSVLVLKKAGVIGLSLPEQDSPIGNSLLFLLIPPKLLI